VKLAKRARYTIIYRADIGDGTKEMDLGTGILFTNTALAEKERDKYARTLGDDAAD
jgi:hypothetical protein